MSNVTKEDIKKLQNKLIEIKAEKKLLDEKEKAIKETLLVLNEEEPQLLDEFFTVSYVESSRIDYKKIFEDYKEELEKIVDVEKYKKTSKFEKINIKK
jgi:Fe-S cluster assembly scaffold protein SufB